VLSPLNSMLLEHGVGFHTAARAVRSNFGIDCRPGHIWFTGVSYGFGHVVRGPVHWLMTRLRRLYVIEQSHFAVSNQSN
jgi:hypothetical protein